MKINDAALRKAAEIPAVPSRDWKLTDFEPTYGGGFKVGILPNTPAAEALQAAYATITNRFVEMLRTWRETAPEVAAYRRAASAERDHLKAIDSARVRALALVGAEGDAEQVAKQVSDAEALVKVLESRTAGLKEATARAAHDLKVALGVYVRDTADLLATFVAGNGESLKREVVSYIGDRLARAAVAVKVAGQLGDQVWREAHVDAAVPELKEAADRARAEEAAAAQKRAAELAADAAFDRPQPATGHQLVSTQRTSAEGHRIVRHGPR